MLLLKNLNLIKTNLDIPSPWGIYFQDSATPQMEGLVELHDNIMYYLVMILFAVAWILLAIIRNYVETKSPISHKYLNHGTLKCLHVNKMSFYNKYFANNNNVKLAFSNKRYSSNKASEIEEISFAEFKINSLALQGKGNIKAAKYYYYTYCSKRLILMQKNKNLVFIDLLIN